MQFQTKKIIYLRFVLLALFISACALYYSYPNIQKKVSNSIILKRSCLKKKITDISTFLQDRSENFNLQNEDCNIISSTMDQIFDLGENVVLFSSFQNLRLWVLIMVIQGVQTRYDILWSPRWPTKVDFQVQKRVAHSGG